MTKYCRRCQDKVDRILSLFRLKVYNTIILDENGRYIVALYRLGTFLKLASYLYKLFLPSLKIFSLPSLLFLYNNNHYYYYHHHHHYHHYHHHYHHYYHHHIIYIISFYYMSRLQLTKHTIVTTIIITTIIIITKP